VRLKDASDAKLTVDGKSLHTLTTLSAKKSTTRSAVIPWFIQFVRMTSGLLYKTKVKKVRELDGYQTENKFETTRQHYENKRSAVAEMDDRGHNRHGPKIGGCAPFRGEKLGPHLTQSRLG